MVVRTRCERRRTASAAKGAMTAHQSQPLHAPCTTMHVSSAQDLVGTDICHTWRARSDYRFTRDKVSTKKPSLPLNVFSMWTTLGVYSNVLEWSGVVRVCAFIHRDRPNGEAKNAEKSKEEGLRGNAFKACRTRSQKFATLQSRLRDGSFGTQIEEHKQLEKECNLGANTERRQSWTRKPCRASIQRVFARSALRVSAQIAFLSPQCATCMRDARIIGGHKRAQCKREAHQD